MSIAAKNAILAGAALPYDAEVEYLQGDGLSFINTGIVVEEGDVITCTMAVASSYGSTYGYFGASDGTGQHLGGGSSCLSPFSDRRFSVWRKNGLFWCAKNVTNKYQDEALHTLRIDISASAPTVSFDGANISYSTSYHSGQDKMPEYPQYIFAINSAGSANIAPASTNLRFATFKIERNGVALIDLVSVRKGTVGYLYDRVSGKLFGNAGTGAFVIGPDK